MTLMRTLLESFIADKLHAYREPTRKGTSRGERVGASRPKYHAMLLALTNDSVVDQANTIDGRYTVVLKWRAQPEFKQAVAALIDEFSTKVIDWVRQNGCDQLWVSSDKSFSDSTRYSKELLSAVQRKAYPKGNSDADSKLFYAVRALLSRAAGARDTGNKDLEQAWKGLDADQRKELAKEYLETIGKVLAKSAPTYLERRNARLLTEMVGKLIE